MRRSSFQAKISMVVVAVMAAMILVSSWVLNQRLAALLENEAARQLFASEGIFIKSLAIRGDNLLSRYGNVVNEPRYVATFKTSDANTIRALLNDLFKEFGPDVKVMLYTDKESKLQVAARRAEDLSLNLTEYETNCAAAVALSLNDQANLDKIAASSRLFDAVSIPVRLPEGIVIGALTVGVEIGDSAAKEFHGLTGSEIVFVSGDSVLASTLQGPGLYARLAGLAQDSSSSQIKKAGAGAPDGKVILAGQHFVWRSGRLQPQSAAEHLGYLLLSSYEQPLQAIADARQTIQWASLAALAVATLFLWAVVRKITEPLRQLRIGAESVGRGDFSARVAVASRDEFGQLAEAFNRMTENLTASRGELEQNVDAIRKTEALYRGAISASGAVPYLWDYKTNAFTYIGRGIQDLTGYGDAEITPLVWQALVTECQFRGELSGCTEQEASRRLREGRVIHLQADCRIVTPDGQSKWVANAAVQILDESGRPTGSIGTLLDITERKNLEEQLRQAQKMDAFGQLAGGVAHDFNNILTVVRGHVELLLSPDYSQASTRDSLQQLSDATDRGANLTRQLLTFSRKQVIQTAPLNLNEVIDNIARMLRRIIGEDIILECHLDACLRTVQADAGMMEQVLMNLAVNARDAMPRGGRLAVSTKTVDVDELHLIDHPEARAGVFVCLSVRDTGSGMPPEILRRIFEPFFTTKGVGKGTGLGLATVYGIVRQHQGWIEVASQVGQGSTFKVFLPAVEGLAKTATQRAPSAAPTGGVETILLVEDEFEVRKLGRLALASLGYRVLEAESGVDAVKIWDANHDSIDLVFTDMVMPDGLSGKDLAERLRLERPGLKVIFTTGYTAEIAGTDAEFIRQKNNYFLQKPYPRGALAGVVRRCLDEAS